MSPDRSACRHDGASLRPADIWLRKLQRFAHLTDDDRQALAGTIAGSRTIRPREDLAVQGDEVHHAILVVSGCLGNARTMPDGERQILSFQFAGDVGDLDDLLFPRIDHAVTALVATEVAVIPRGALIRVRRGRPAVAAALRGDQALEKAIAREWQVNVGRRTAHQRLAHLLVEILHRLKAANAAFDHRISLPLTQNDIADTTSLSFVHVNRIFQEWRSTGLIGIEDRRIHIRDEEVLQRIAGFDAAYLDRIGAEDPMAGAA